MENLDKLEKDEIKMLENYLKEYRREHNIYMRILAVRMVKLGQTRTNVGKFIKIEKLLEIGLKLIMNRELMV